MWDQRHYLLERIKILIINILSRADTQSVLCGAAWFRLYNQSASVVCMHAFMLADLSGPLSGLIMREALRAFIIVLPHMLFPHVPGKEI